MATIVSKLVPNPTAANEYSSVASWLAAYGGSASADLVANGDSIVLECYKGDYTAVGGGQDYIEVDSIVNLNSFTTSETNTTSIVVPQSERHNGTPNTGFRFVFTRNYQGFCEIQHGTLEGVSVEVTGTYNQRNCISSSDGKTLFDSVLVVSNSPNSTGGCGAFRTNRGSTHINCIAIDVNNHQYRDGYYLTRYRESYYYNCTVVGFKTGFSQNATSDSTHDNRIRIKNCVAYGNGVDFYSAGSTPINGSTNNASGQYTTNSAIGANPLTQNVVAADFADPTNHDYRLSSTSALIGAGVDLSAEFTTDVEGETRVAWDVGFDEFIAQAEVPASPEAPAVTFNSVYSASFRGGLGGLNKN